MPDWDHLKFLLEYYRSSSFAEAARRLGVNETTVSRRLRKLEDELGKNLIVWNGKNPVGLSEDALSIVNSLFDAEKSIENALSSSKPRITRLRLSAVPFILNHVIIPNIGEFLDTTKGIEIELVPDQRNVNLSKREADIALRFARPQQGGQTILAQKIGTVKFIAIGTSADAKVPWIKYENGSSYLPQSMWTEALAQNDDCAPILVADIDGALQAVLAGFGKAFLPISLLRSSNKLSLINNEAEPHIREVWMLSHKTSASRPELEALKNWLRQLDFE